MLRDTRAMYWSIGVEFKYYFISPLIIYASAKILNWKINYINVFLFSIVVASLIYFNFIPYKNFRLLNYIPFFLVGTFLGIKEVQNIKKYNYDYLIPVLFLIILSIGFIFDYLSIKNTFANIVYINYSFLMGVLLMLAKDSKGFFTKILESKPIRLIGNISFSMYLFHELSLYLVHDYGTEHDYINSIIYLGITFSFSIISYLLIEYPLSKVRFTKNKYLKLANSEY